MKWMKSLSFAAFLTFLVSCGQGEKATTQVYPPNLSFSDPEFVEKFENEATEIPTYRVEKLQVFAEFPTASSFLDAWQEESYHAYCTMDGDETTAWVENASGLGSGEWVEHSFQWPEQVQEISFYNGHGGYPNDFAIAKKIELSFSTGDAYIYMAEPGWNTVVLPAPLDTTYVRLKILEGYASQREDVAISEIKLYNVSEEPVTEILDKNSILKEMGALGDCSNITSEQAAAFAAELQQVMDWAESNSATRAYMGDGYEKYTGEALLFSGGDGVPVLYYDYDFLKVDELFLTKTDVVVWDGEQAHSSYFEKMGEETMINWILPGLVYVNNDQYFFGLTEYDLYGSGSFGLIGMVGFDRGIPRPSADYLAFISHNSTGVYTYGMELGDYLKMPVLSWFPTYQLEELITSGQQDYFEFNGIDFEVKNLVWDPTDYTTWYSAIRGARVEAGYEQVVNVQSGATVLAGLLALS